MAIKATLTITEQKFPSGGNKFKVRGNISFTGTGGTDYTTGGLTMQYLGAGGVLTDMTTTADLQARLGLINSLTRFVVDPMTRISAGSTLYIAFKNVQNAKLQLSDGLAEIANNAAVLNTVVYTGQFEAEGT